MPVILFVSFILHMGYSQGRVPEVVYTWQDSDVTLECRADTKEEIKQITWQRQINGTSTTFFTYRNDTGRIDQTLYGHRVRFKGDGYKDGSIQILNIMLADEGIFKCVFITFPSGNIEREIQLQVLVLPSVRQELKQDIRTPCLNLVAECLASSAKPAAEIQWITHGVNYTSKEDTIKHPNGTTSKKSQLYMMSTPELYGHEVLCLVYQPKIPFEHQKNITINDTLSNIQFPPQIVHIEVVKKDENLQLLCKSDANPRPKYNWKREDTKERKVIPLDRYQVTTATLDFSNVYDDGLYICEAENAVGVSQGYIYMYSSKSSSRFRLGLVLSIIFIVCSVFLGACYMIKSRLSNTGEYKPHIRTQQSREDNCEEKPERNITPKEEEGHRVKIFNLHETEQKEDTEEKKNSAQSPTESTKTSELGKVSASVPCYQPLHDEENLTVLSMR